MDADAERVDRGFGGSLARAPTWLGLFIAIGFPEFPGLGALGHFRLSLRDKRRGPIRRTSTPRRHKPAAKIGTRCTQESVQGRDRQVR